MKAKVDPDLCTGCEQCVDEVPEVFQMNDEGLAEAKAATVPADKEDAARQAGEDCPAAAIEIEE